MSAPKKETAVWKNLLAGGMAGATEAAIMYPTEFAKTQLQLSAKAASKEGVASVQYTGMIDCLKQHITKKGPLSVYSGLSTLIVGAIPKAAIRFGAFEQLRKMLKSPDAKELTTFQTMMAGCGAGIAESFVVGPAECLKTRLIHDQNLKNPRYNGLVNGASTIIREEGIQAIFKGLAPTMAKQSCNQMTRFTIFKGITNELKGGDPTVALNPVLNFACGFFAGAVSVYATMPFDVVKTQMQGLSASNYSNSIDCARKLVQADGVAALWKGTVPRLSRVCFSGGIIFTCFEQYKKVLAPF